MFKCRFGCNVVSALPQIKKEEIGARQMFPNRNNFDSKSLMCRNFDLLLVSSRIGLDSAQNTDNKNLNLENKCVQMRNTYFLAIYIAI